MKIEKKYNLQGDVIDIVLSINNRTMSMLGSSGIEREKNIVARFLLLKEYKKEEILPVVLGSGLGYAINELLLHTSGPIAVIDKEEILEYTKLKENITDKRVFWIHSSDTQEVLIALTQWQNQHNGKLMKAFAHPFYLRFDKEWYQSIHQQIEASTKFNFWGKAVQPRFKKKETRLLLITTRYFIIGALEEACKKIGIQYQLLVLPDKEWGCSSFIEKLLHSVVSFYPDFILTINHFGVDKEGVLMDLIAKLQLPMASWFVDNPHLIIHEYKDVVSPWVTIFTWDQDNIHSLYELGFNYVYYLPLGTSQYSFKPKTMQDIPISSLFPTQVSFVGNSMVSKVKEQMVKGEFSLVLSKDYKEIALKFISSEEHSIQKFLKEQYPVIYNEYLILPTIEQRLAYEAMITWEATLQYRKRCVEELLSFSPVIVGDVGWKKLLLQQGKTWSYQPEVGYYSTLPLVYLFSDINFNCTSRQMKSAVNQRVFDVPATGSFIITDWQSQIEMLFEPQKEMIMYHNPEEIKDLVQYYLLHPIERDVIVKAGRRRVLAEHTWEHRLQKVLAKMKQIYG